VLPAPYPRVPLPISRPFPHTPFPISEPYAYPEATAAAWSGKFHGQSPHFFEGKVPINHYGHYWKGF
jgi:hypothetical protein